MISFSPFPSLVFLLSVVLCVHVIPSSAVWAQLTGTITADPDAKALRPIWQVHGNPVVGFEYVGRAAAGLGDLFGTGRGAWAIYFGKRFQWRFYRNTSTNIAADTIPFKTFDNYGTIPPLVGDFWGKGNKGVVMFTGTNDTAGGTTIYFQELHAFHVESDTISDSIATMMNSRMMTPRAQLSIVELLSADLDGDEADEVIMMLAGIVRDTGISYIPEIWIFRGGSEFRLDTPTVIVRDVRKNDFLRWGASVGDFDGDRHPDILTGGNAGATNDTPRVTIYWGAGNLDDFRDIANRRTITFTEGYPLHQSDVISLDCDGDRIADLAIEHSIGTPSLQGVYLYRSGTGKNARTRSYRVDDADVWFPAYASYVRGGFINDSARRYEMLGLRQYGTSPHTLFFSGGTDGPDLRYEASMSRAYVKTIPVRDVDGDGWDDLLCADFHEGGLNAGAAVLYAGGPYIPAPKVSGVEAIAGDGHDRAITLWPNPVHEELHIAWRGDLRRMPRSFIVHDLTGCEVARGEVPAGTSTAIWHCADASTGIYLVSIYDAQRACIGTMSIIKH